MKLAPLDHNHLLTHSGESTTPAAEVEQLLHYPEDKGALHVLWKVQKIVRTSMMKDFLVSAK